ncbi:hypothetical protein FOZ61_004216 [Perkinsus olseni]|uniref:Uncharacterized protein n=1 Tax=Perkinsus olseni TaxID=32597 RepID=A0A7J6LLL5_PEROL|nr:hypothetical protein FOZ61_004216 [Perkinsus olseni]
MIAHYGDHSCLWLASLQAAAATNWIPELSRAIQCASSTGRFLDFWADTPPHELPPCVDDCSSGPGRATVLNAFCARSNDFVGETKLGFTLHWTCPRIGDPSLSGCEWSASPSAEEGTISALQYRDIAGIKIGQMLRVPPTNVHCTFMYWSNAQYDWELEYFNLFRYDELDGRTLREELKNLRKLQSNDEPYEWYLACRVDTQRLLPTTDGLEIFSTRNAAALSSVFGRDILFFGDVSVSITPSPAPMEASSFPLAIFIATISAALAVVIGTTILVRRSNKYRVVPDVLASAMAEAEADDRFASQPSSSSLDENYQDRMREAREVVNPFKRFAKQHEEQQRAQARRLEKAKREREEREKERREMKKEKEKQEQERAQARKARETAREAEAARSKKEPEPAASNEGKPSSASAEQACLEDLGASAELSAVRELRCELEKSKADEPHRKRKRR